MVKSSTHRTTDYQLRASAYHEAGHTVGAFVCGFDVGRCLTNELNLSYDGAGHIPKGLYFDSPDVEVSS